jgi:Astacin (Peptidase family M12A)
MLTRCQRPGPWRAGLVALFASGCAQLVGLDLEGWQHEEGDAGMPPLTGGAGGVSDAGSAGKNGGAGQNGGAGKGGGDASLGGLCTGLLDARGEGASCCAEQAAACALPPPLPPLACGPYARPSPGVDYLYRLIGALPCDPPDSNTCFEGRVRAAADTWRAASAGQISFAPAAAQQESMEIEAKRGACYAEAVSGRGPKLWLDPDGADGCDAAAYAHLFGHVLGLPHLLQRADRDRYLDVDATRVPCGCDDEVLQPCGPDFGQIGPFDYASIMAYPASPPADAPLFTDKKGHVPPRPVGVTALDGSAALEALATSPIAGSEGWQPFAALGRDAETSLPPDPSLPGGASVVGAPASVVGISEGADFLWLFVLGDDGHIYARGTPFPWTSSAAARSIFSSSEWADLGGGFDSEPSATLTTGSAVTVVARRPDGHLYHRSLGEPTWASLGAPPPGAASAPALARVAQGCFVVLLRGGDGRLWRQTFCDAPGAWHDYPLLIAGQPAVAAGSSGQLDVAALSPGPTPSVLYIRRAPNECTFASDAWCEWEDLGGAPVEGSSPAIVTGPERLQIFFAGPGSLVWSLRHDDKFGWHLPRPLGGLFPAGVAAASWTDGRITLYAVGPTHASGELNEAGRPTLFERTFYPGGFPTFVP